MWHQQSQQQQAEFDSQFDDLESELGALRKDLQEASHLSPVTKLKQPTWAPHVSV